MTIEKHSKIPLNQAAGCATTSSDASTPEPGTMQIYSTTGKGNTQTRIIYYVLRIKKNYFIANMV